MTVRRKIISLVAVTVFAAGVAGCNLPSAQPPVDHNATAAAQTIAAQLTALALTPVPPAATTPAPPPTEAVVTPTTTSTPPPIPTSTNTPTTVPCDRAQWVTDVNYPDGTDLAPGTAFTKTWRIQNTGTCTWTSSYSLVFYSGDSMSAPAAVPLTTGTVAPGQTVDVSVPLVAPSTAGTYQGYFRLRNPAGVVFGFGSGGTGSIWAKIDVVVGTTLVYSFVDHVCEAEWRSASGVLPCPGTVSDAAGFVIVVNNPKFENGTTEDEPALETHPQWIDNGVISGRFPAITVQAGDRFRSFIGCAWKSGGSACSVQYQFNYRIGGGPLQSFGAWTETYDGSWTELNIDLSSLAGQSVNFVLAVSANGPSNQDWALWLNPRIVR